MSALCVEPEPKTSKKHLLAVVNQNAPAVKVLQDNMTKCKTLAPTPAEIETWRKEASGAGPQIAVTYIKTWIYDFQDRCPT